MMEIYNLYLLDSFNGDYINGYNNITVYLLSLFAIISGVLVIVSKNPIVSVLFLIGLFLNIALYLISLGLNFIGLSYLLVYIGAISILFLFILMLINVRISELLIDSNNSIPLLIIIFCILYPELEKIVPPHYIDIYIEKLYYCIWTSFSKITNIFNIDLNSEITPKVISLNWDNNLFEVSHIASIGNLMYTSYSIWLILTSIILLLAMVGCIVITINPKK